MRRLLSILLLGLLLFNVGGYRLLFQHWQVRQDTQANRQLDNAQYNAQELLTIKVPVNLPYYTNAPEYERFQGETVINGQVYRYVKKRIYNDSLEIVCLPDHGKTALQNAREEFFKLCHDLNTAAPEQKKGPATLSFKPFTFDYCESLFSFHLAPPADARPLLPAHDAAHYQLLTAHSVDHPPEAGLI